MQRKKFISKSLLGFGGIVGLSSIIDACSKNEASGNGSGNNGACAVSPSETKGPFPIKTPAQLVLANIKSDRTGIALLMNITIQNKSNNCAPLSGVLVDVWHCDKDGNYSEYGGTQMQTTNYTNVHFLRGRQTTDSNGKVAFITIYPGWYPGRAPHIHVEVLTASGSSLLVTQMAFPENVSSQVYGSALYVGHGQADTSNTRDGIFSDSINNELATVTGNLVDGYTLSHTIVVNA
jgi:protocatechuate 3,4-dioxygenase beta subunit